MEVDQSGLLVFQCDVKLVLDFELVLYTLYALLYVSLNVCKDTVYEIY